MNDDSFDYITITTHLKDHYGEEVILFNDAEESEIHRIMAEFIFEQHAYAVLQTEEQKKEGEFEILEIIKDKEDNIELVTVDDEDIWENVAEIYDEMIFERKINESDKS